MYRHRLVFKERFEIAKRNMEEILNTQCIAILKDKLTLLKADIQESQTSLLKNDKKLIEFIDNLNNKSRYSTSQNLNLKLMVTDLYIGHFILSKPSGSCENINPDSFELFTDFINLSLSEKDTAFIDKFYETMEKDLFVQCPNIYKYNNICKLRQLLHTIRFIINTLKTFDNDNKNEFFSLQSSMIDEEE